LFTVDTEKIAVKEREAFNKLEQAGRQWFLATLSNQFVEEPLQEAMPDVSPDDPIHKEGKRRLQKNYKSWKHRTLKDALEWMRASRPENSKYNATANFACQRMAYDTSLDTTEVFAWAQEAICCTDHSAGLDSRVTGGNPHHLVSLGFIYKR
jgi:hypothetical protein